MAIHTHIVLRSPSLKHKDIGENKNREYVGEKQKLSCWQPHAVEFFSMPQRLRVCECRNFHFVARVRLPPALCPLSAHLALSSLYLPRRCLSYFCVTLEFPCPTRTSLCFRFRFRFTASAFCLSCCFCCPLLSSAAHFQSSMCAASVIFLSTRSIQFLAPFPFVLPGFSLFSDRFVFSPAIFINKFACQMTLFMVFLYERHSHIYLDPRPSSFCHTLLTSLLKYVYMLKLVFCLCRLSSAVVFHSARSVCLPVRELTDEMNS